MAIARMDRLFLLGMRKDQTAIVSALTKLGAVEVREEETLKQAFVEALYKAEGNEEDLPSLEELDASILLNAQDDKPSSLQNVENVLPPAANENGHDTERSDWGRGEGTPAGGGETIAARYYFYDLMQHFADSDEEAPSGTHEFMMQTRTRELLDDEEDSEEDLRRAVKATADTIRPQDIPQLRRLCQNYGEWLSKLIPEAMRLSGQKRPMFTLKREVKTEDYAEAGRRQAEIIDAAIGLEQVLSDMDRTRQEIAQVHASMNVLEPWRNLSLPAPAKPGERDWGIRTFTGSFPSRDQLEEAQALISDSDLPAALEPLGQSTTESVAVLVAYLEDSQQDVRAALDDLGFAELPKLSGLRVASGDYKQAWEKQRQRVARLEEDLAELEVRGKEFAAYKPDFEVLHDFYQVQDNKLAAMEDFIQTNHIFILTGYVPSALSGNISQVLADRYNVVVEISETKNDEAYPILLQNNKVTQPFESVLRTFSLPKPGYDVDPTPFLAFFYVIFFGMMLGDIGYGAALAAVMGFLLWKVKVQGNFRDMTKVLFMSGLVSIPFGFLFGGFFGDFLTTVSEGSIQFPALLLNPLDDPINMLIFSMGAGIIHLFAGMALDIRAKFGLGDWQGALFGVAPWYLIISGFIGMLVGLDWARWPVIIGFAVLILLSSPDRNPIKRIFGGLSSLTDLGNWLGDVLSYARVLALALATSVIAMVVNILGMMPGYKGLSIVPFIIIMVFGHLLNLALSGLSAYVHTLRLQYVEFFGKFYEGGGRLFAPLNYETRYTYASQTEDAQQKISRGEFPRVKARFAQADPDEPAA